MQDWQIKPLSKKSALSQRDISAGDTVVCAVFVDELGNLDRADFLKDEFDAAKVAGKLVGRWERIVSDDPAADERAARRMSLAGSEDFFVSLFDKTVSLESEESDAVKQILALLLERKRVLKPLGRPSGGIQKYLHSASGREFFVPQKELDEDTVLKLGSQISSIII